MAEGGATPVVSDDTETLQREVRRLNKVVAALMNRAERDMSARTSDFALFQTTVSLEAEIRRRTQELEAALHENEKVNRALAREKEEQRELIKKLEEAHNQLLQSEKLASIGEMSAAVAHGLKNPLASLRASAQLVLRHPQSPAAPEQLGAIIAEVDRLDRRITHLLAFSRPAPFRPLPERLAALVQQALPAFAERGRQQRVTVDLRIPDDLPDIAADAVTLEQTLVELISNAFDAMPDGGQLTLAAVPAPGPAGRPGVRLTLADTGRGIAPEALPQVGQPFFTTRPEGTGLGVATARRFVAQHGGTLDIASERGRGTTVTLWLPTAAPGSTA